MTNLLPQNFPAVPPEALATLTFTDLVNGNGILTLYGATHEEAGTTSYYLTTNQIYSNTVLTSGSTVQSATPVKILDKNFDVTFQRPIDFKGYAHLNVTYGGYATSGTGTLKMFISGASLQNATTSQTLVTASGAILTFVNNDSTQSLISNMQFDLTGGPYHFSRGQVFRLNLPLWGVSSAASSAISYPGFGHDPKERDDPDPNRLSVSGGHTTQMALYLPVFLDIS